MDGGGVTMEMCLMSLVKMVHFTLCGFDHIHTNPLVSREEQSPSCAVFAGLGPHQGRQSRVKGASPLPWACSDCGSPDSGGPVASCEANSSVLPADAQPSTACFQAPTKFIWKSKQAFKALHGPRDSLLVGSEAEA